MDAIGRQHMRPDQVVRRRQVRRAGAHPVGQGGGIEVDALAGKRLALPVQRQMLPELRLQDCRQQLGPGSAARDRVERRRRLRDRLAGAAGEPLAHRLDHLPLARDHLQRLSDVFPKLGQLAIAAGARGRSRNDHPLARQMRRQRSARRLAANGRAGRLLPVRIAGRIEGRLILGRLRLEFLKLKFQLVQQLAAAFGRGAEPLMPQLGNQQLQMRRHRLGAGRAGLGIAPRQPLGHQRRAQRRDVVGKRAERGIHAADSSISAGGRVLLFCRQKDQPAISGRHVRCGFRQSIPSSSIERVAGVSDTTPSLACGQTNRPRSSRLA